MENDSTDPIFATFLKFRQSSRERAETQMQTPRCDFEGRNRRRGGKVKDMRPTPVALARRHKYSAIASRKRLDAGRRTRTLTKLGAFLYAGLADDS